MRFIHTSDLHLGRYYKGELPKEIAKKRREELWMSFEKIIKYCKNNNIELLLLTGDLFEREYFTLNDMNRFVEILNTLKLTKIIIIAGNHDYISENSLYNKVEFNENIYIFRDEDYFDIEELNLRIHGISWDVPNNLNKNIKIKLKEDSKNILMLHGSVGTDEYFPININDLKESNLDYIALGHIHLPQKILDNCYYPGSPEGLNFKETGKRGFILGELKEGLKIQFIENQIRKYNALDIEVTSDMNFMNIKEEIYNNLEGKEEDLNRINLTGFWNDPEYLKQNLDFSSKYFYVEINNNVKKDINIEQIYLENKDNIIGKFIELTKENEYALNIGLEALLEAQSEN